MTSIYDPEATHLGLDVHKDTISVGVLEPRCETPVVDRVFHDEPSVRRLVDRFECDAEAVEEGPGLADGVEGRVEVTVLAVILRCAYRWPRTPRTAVQTARVEAQV